MLRHWWLCHNCRRRRSFRHRDGNAFVNTRSNYHLLRLHLRLQMWLRRQLPQRWGHASGTSHWCGRLCRSCAGLVSSRWQRAPCHLWGHGEAVGVGDPQSGCTLGGLRPSLQKHLRHWRRRGGYWWCRCFCCVHTRHLHGRWYRARLCSDGGDLTPLLAKRLVLRCESLVLSQELVHLWLRLHLLGLTSLNPLGRGRVAGPLPVPAVSGTTKRCC
mmetsp:Transcript_139464/g.347776  ORF Transcript_139464/g.347776 Transcript_139464/m.347776 type:complete len:215 (-) Transcript_139464:572-1216(-)